MNPQLAPEENAPTIEPTPAPFSLTQFSLNGKSAAMREKMLNDTFVGVPILTRRKRTLRDFNHVEALCLLTFSLKSFNFIDGKNTP